MSLIQLWLILVTKPLTAPRAYWKAAYRLIRINRRESRKAFMDTLLFGTGFVEYQPNGETRHIPIEQVRVGIPAMKWRPPVAWGCF